MMKDKLRMLRKELDLNQSDVADQMNVSRGTYASYENGITPPTSVVMKLAAYYQVSTDYLLGLSPERNPSAGALGEKFVALGKMVGEKTITASEIASLLDAMLLYYRKGAPSGDVPMKALHDFVSGLTDALTAAAKDDVPQLLDSANAASAAALDVMRMLPQYYENRETTP